MAEDPGYQALQAGALRDGELYDLELDPEELNNLWAEPEYQELRATIVERLLAPFGAFRDPGLREATEGYRRRTSSQVARRYKKKDPRMLENEKLAEERGSGSP